jgi:hypothetical protein
MWQDFYIINPTKNIAMSCSFWEAKTNYVVLLWGVEGEVQAQQ